MIKHDFFNEKATIGIEFATKSYEITDESIFKSDGTTGFLSPSRPRKFQPVKVIIKVQIWDTAGQERYKTLTNSYYRNAHGIIFMFDLTRDTTLKNIQNYWLPEMENYVFDLEYESGADAHRIQNMLLLGNKSELANVDDSHGSYNPVANAEILSFCKDKNLIYEKISCKNNYKIDSTFKILIKNIYLGNVVKLFKADLNYTSVMSNPTCLSLASRHVKSLKKNQTIDFFRGRLNSIALPMWKKNERNSVGPINVAEETTSHEVAIKSSNQCCFY